MKNLMGKSHNCVSFLLSIFSNFSVMLGWRVRISKPVDGD